MLLLLLLLLNDSLAKIKKSLKKTNKEYLLIGEELKKILDEGWYKEKNKSFDRFILEETGMTGKNARFYIRHFEITELLKESKAKYTPPYTSISRKLDKIKDDDELVKFWELLTPHIKKQDIEGNIVGAAVEKFEEGDFEKNTKGKIENILSDTTRLRPPRERFQENEIDEKLSGRGITDFFPIDKRVLDVFSNFAKINREVVLEDNFFPVINLKETVIGYFSFDRKVAHPPFGLDMREFLEQYNSNQLRVEITEETLFIHDPAKETPIEFPNRVGEIIPVENVRSDFERLSVLLRIQFDSEMFDYVKSSVRAARRFEYVCFQNGKNNLVVSFADADRIKSTFNRTVQKDSITENDLGSKAVFIPKKDFSALLQGDYDLVIGAKDENAGVSSWVYDENVMQLEYFIECHIEG